jgi:hypothetical protein
MSKRDDLPPFFFVEIPNKARANDLGKWNAPQDLLIFSQNGGTAVRF